MNFSQLEAKIAEQYTEMFGPRQPSWTDFRRVRYDMDGLVHRVTVVREFGMAVHDEVDIELQPWTGCGIPLVALVKEAGMRPEQAGFTDEATPLTCFICASDRMGAGDRRRIDMKNLGFMHGYGKSYNLKNIAAQVLGPQSINRHRVFGRVSRPGTFRQQLARKLLELAGKP